MNKEQEQIICYYVYTLLRVFISQEAAYAFKYEYNTTGDE